MANTENKVQYNLKNVHYAIYDDTAGTWAAPVHVPGAVSLTLDPQGDTSPFYADGIKYYTSVANNGYSGDLEMALMSKRMKADIWGIAENEDKVLIENAEVEPKQFALLFQIDGDKRAACNLLYNCTAARPSVGSKTTEGGKDVQTQKCTVDAAPLPNGRVMATTTADTPEDIINGWFNAVYTGTDTPAAPTTNPAETPTAEG